MWILTNVSVRNEWKVLDQAGDHGFPAGQWFVFWSVGLRPFLAAERRVNVCGRSFGKLVSTRCLTVPNSRFGNAALIDRTNAGKDAVVSLFCWPANGAQRR
jgi:hypothetical protein